MRNYKALYTIDTNVTNLKYFSDPYQICCLSPVSKSSQTMSIYKVSAKVHLRASLDRSISDAGACIGIPCR